jgi:hypothetical protein
LKVLVACGCKDLHGVQEVRHVVFSVHEGRGVIGELHPHQRGMMGRPWDAHPVGAPPLQHGLANKKVQQRGKWTTLANASMKRFEPRSEAVHDRTRASAIEKGGHPCSEARADAKPLHHSEEKGSIDRVKGLGKVAKDGYCASSRLLQ